MVYLGIWLLIAPNTWNYASIIMTWNNVLVGLAALIFGVWRVGELSQDRLQWRTSDERNDRRRAAAGTAKRERSVSVAERPRMIARTRALLATP